MFGYKKYDVYFYLIYVKNIIINMLYIFLINKIIMYINIK